MTENQTSPFANATNFRAHLDKIQADAIKVEPINTQTKQPEVIKNDNESAETAPVPEKESMEETNIDDSKGDEESSNEITSESKPVKESRYIPKSRLKEETEKRRVAEEQLLKEREERLKERDELIRAQEQLKLFNEMNAIKKQEPTPNKVQFEPLDPEAYEDNKREIQGLRDEIKSLKANTSSETKALKMESTIRAQRDEFERNNSDFKQALEHYTNWEIETAKLFVKGEDKAKEAAAKKIAHMVQVAYDNNDNVAETFYNLAKRAGYKSESKEEEPRTPKVDLDAVNKNKEKTASIGKLGNKVNLGGNSSNVFDISQCLRDPKNPNSGIDPAKFKQFRARIAKTGS